MKTFNILLLGIACAISGLQAMDTGNEGTNPFFIYDFKKTHDEKIEGQLAKILTANYSEYFDPHNPLKDFCHDGSVLFIKKDQNKIIGFIADNDQNHGRWFIAIDKNYEGLVPAMLSDMTKYCDATGRIQKNLATQHPNVSAYQQAGFTVVTPINRNGYQIGYEYSKPKPTTQPAPQSIPLPTTPPVAQPFWKTYQKTIIGGALILATAGIYLKYWRKAPLLLKYKN